MKSRTADTVKRMFTIQEKTLQKEEPTSNRTRKSSPRFVTVDQAPFRTTKLSKKPIFWREMSRGTISTRIKLEEKFSRIGIQG